LENANGRNKQETKESVKHNWSLFGEEKLSATDEGIE